MVSESTSSAPNAPILTSINAVDPLSIGADWINLSEVNATVRVQVSLLNTNAAAGDTLELLWIRVPDLNNRSLDIFPSSPFTLALSTANINANTVAMQVPLSVIGLVQGTGAIRLRLVDKSGNASNFTVDQLANIDTLVPSTLATNTWMGNNKIGQTEASAIQNLTGNGAETGSRIEAKLGQGANSYDLLSTDITVNANGSWELSASSLQQLISAIPDGDFVIDVRQIDSHENAGAWSSNRYFKDTSPPNAPGAPQIQVASDGWINASDALALTIEVSLVGTGVRQGDIMRVRGLQRTFSQVISSTDVLNSKIIFSVDSSDILQVTGASARTGLQILAEIEDGGGNISPVSAVFIVGLDTIALAPLVNINALTDGIVGNEAINSQSFSGTGVEAGAILEIRITGDSGRTLVLAPTVAADGTYTSTLAPGDFVTLGEGAASYSVVQTDIAGNVSPTTSGVFGITLTTPEPSIADFANDNVVGVRPSDGLSEWLITLPLRGSAVAGSTVTVDVFLTNDISPVITGLTAVTGSNGLWSLDITAADFSTLRTAAGVSSFSAYFKATATLSGSRSNAVTQAIQISAESPNLSSSVARFDANGDGANNDGLEISFTEPVRVLDLSNLNIGFNTNRTWGTGSRIEAINPVSLNGVQFAQFFKIFLGSDSTIVGGDIVGLDQNRIVNVGGNLAVLSQSFTVPSLTVPVRPVPSLNISTDNLISDAEKLASTSVTYTYASVAAGTEVKLFMNGVEVTSAVVGTTQGSGSTSTTFNLTGANTWGLDGGKTLVAQLVSANGLETSLISVPKTVTVDSSLAQGVSSIQVSVDNLTLGTADAGDKVKVIFNEAVTIPGAAGNLPSIFGTNASAIAIGAVGGRSATWEVTLGQGSNLVAGQNLNFSNATDQAGNTLSSGGNLGVTATLAKDVFTTPQKPIIANVSSDNVITNSERGANQIVRVNLTGSKANDEVKLFMDGLEIGRVTVATDGQLAATFGISASTWGADGTRNLTSSITRGSQTVDSGLRSVYVSGEQSHWSALTSGGFWFDPDALNLQDGAQVSSWNATVGLNAAGSQLSVSTGNGSVIKTTDSAGHTMLWFNGSASLNSTALLSTPSVGGGYADFSVLKTITPVDFWSYSMTQYIGNGTSTPFRHHFGTGGGGFGTSFAVTSHLSGGNGGFALTSPNNSTTANVWMILNGFVTGASSTTNTMNVAVDQNTLATRVISSSADGGVNARTYTPVAKYALIFGGSQDGAGSTFAGQMVTALMADQISFKLGITDAQRNEVATYLAAKYESTGSVIKPNQGSAVYDLSIKNGTTLIDEMLQLQLSSFGLGNDTVTTAGADYVNTGSGNDTVKVKDLAFRTLDGGLGRDTWALDVAYSGTANIVLADFVSNSRGTGSDVMANTRVNAAGFHKLQGFERLDLSGSSGLQVVTVNTDDVNQLSETNTLEVKLGRNDILLTQGFGGAERGAFRVNANWYDTSYSAVTTDGQNLALYSFGGNQKTTLSTAKWTSGNQLLQLGLDHAMLTGTLLAGDFSYSGLGTLDIFSNVIVASISQRQGIQFSFSNALTGPVKITYNNSSSSSPLLDENGRSFSSNIWLVGTTSADIDTTFNGITTNRLNASTLSASEQSNGVVIIGAGGADRLTGGSGADTLIGGLGVDTLTGGDGADTFRYVNEITGSGADGNLGGTKGDVITDFNFGIKNGVLDAKQADRLDLRDLFSTTFTGNANTDANTLVNNGYLGITNVIRRVNGIDFTDWQLWVDRDGKDAGGSNTLGLLTTIQNIQLENLDTGIFGGESETELLRRMLEEGRLVVAAA